MTGRRRTNLAAAILIGAICGLPAHVPAAQAPYFTSRNLQAAIEALQLVDLQGKRWTSEDLEDRVVLIDFWATWCAPCLAQIPDLKQLRTKFGDRFEVLAISLDSRSRRDLVSWLNRRDITWPQVHDGRAFSSPAARSFGVAALPASLLLANGRIVGANLRGEALEAAIRSALTY